jgi:hypothetical protein
MNQNVPKTGQGSQVPGKIRWHYTQFPHFYNRIVIIQRRRGSH